MAEKLKSLKESHQHIKRLAAQGKSTAEIAEIMGMHPDSVGNIKRSPLFQVALAGHRMAIDEEIAKTTADSIVNDPVVKIFEEAKVDAAAKVVGLMRHAQSEKLQSDNAWEILNRTGYRPKEGPEGKQQVVIAAEQMLVLNQALSECS